jgi:hypothetical protein
MVRVLQPGDEALLETFLQPRIESSMFLLGNLRTAGLVDNGRSYQGTYAAVFEGDRIVGAVAIFWNGSLVLQAPVERIDGLWQTAVSTAQRPITRLIGPRQQVQAVLEQLNISQSAIQWDEPENLYSLHLDDLQSPRKLQTGEWQGRRLQAGDIEFMTRWRVGYALEALGETESPELWRQMRDGVQKYLQLGRTWILEDRGHPVSTSSFNTSTTELVQVGVCGRRLNFAARGTAVRLWLPHYLRYKRRVLILLSSSPVKRIFPPKKRMKRWAFAILAITA